MNAPLKTTRVLLPILACLPLLAGEAPAPAPATEPAAEPAARPKRVVLFMIDGLQARAPERLKLATFNALAPQGTWYKECIISLPDRIQKDKRFGTVVSNITIVTGTILWSQTKDPQQLGEAFRAKGATVHVAEFPSYGAVNKGFTASVLNAKGDQAVVDATLRLMKQHDPVFTRLHLQETGNNASGDKNGGNIWSAGSIWTRKATEADRLLGTFIEALKRDGKWEGTLLAVTADHGTADQGMHPAYVPESWRTPLLLVGPGIKAGQVLEYADCIDIAPTLTYAVGVAAPRDCQGRVLAEAFVTPPPDAKPQEKKMLAFNESARACHDKGVPEDRWMGVHNLTQWGRFNTIDEVIAFNKKALGE